MCFFQQQFDVLLYVRCSKSPRLTMQYKITKVLALKCLKFQGNLCEIYEMWTIICSQCKCFLMTETTIISVHIKYTVMPSEDSQTKRHQIAFYFFFFRFLFLPRYQLSFIPTVSVSISSNSLPKTNLMLLNWYKLEKR